MKTDTKCNNLVKAVNATLSHRLSPRELHGEKGYMAIQIITENYFDRFAEKTAGCRTASKTHLSPYF